MYALQVGGRDVEAGMVGWGGYSVKSEPRREIVAAPLHSGRRPARYCLRSLVLINAHTSPSSSRYLGLLDFVP